MPAAQSLSDLIRIRDANRNAIDAINGNLGSALGFKRTTGQPISEVPAILIFVPRKVNPKWIPSGQLIPAAMDGPDSLTCPVDVVEARDYEETYLWSQDSGDKIGSSALSLTPLRNITSGQQLNADQLRLRQQLRGWHDSVTPGAMCEWSPISQ